MIVAASFNHVQTYNFDLKRKPVSEFTFKSESLLKSLQYCNGSFLIGDNVGGLFEVSEKGQIISKYRGLSSGFVGIHKCKNGRVVTVGIDRILTVFECGKKVEEVYMKTRVSGLVVEEDLELEESGDLWDEMEIVGEGTGKRKCID
jgi:hypothetical protein